VESRSLWRLARADAWAIIGPVNWYGPSSNLKAMFDRLVCMNGGNPRPDLIDKKDTLKAQALERSPLWQQISKNHLSGRTAASFCYGDDGANEEDGHGKPKKLDHPEWFDAARQPQRGRDERDAYPAGGAYDECRPTKSDHDRALGPIAKTKTPRTDPVYGAKARSRICGVEHYRHGRLEHSGAVQGPLSRSGSQLERYAARFNGVEINSSFYRTHKRVTMSAGPLRCRSVPLCGEIPRTITQNHRLKDYGSLLEQFLDGVSGLGGKLGVLLVQLPPSLAYDLRTAAGFFTALANVGSGHGLRAPTYQLVRAGGRHNAAATTCRAGCRRSAAGIR